MEEGATINTSNVSISMGTGTSSNPNVTNIGDTVQGAGIGTGPYNIGPNVIECGGNTVVNIKSTGRIIQTGGANNGETSNPTDSNNTINKNGSGTWIVGAPSRLSDLASNVTVNVNAGTLTLADNESSSQTKATIASGATL